MHHIIRYYAQCRKRFPILWGHLIRGENLKTYHDLAKDALYLANTRRSIFKPEVARIGIVSSMIQSFDNLPRPKSESVERIIDMVKDSEYDDACEFVAGIVVGHEDMTIQEIVKELTDIR